MNCLYFYFNSFKQHLPSFFNRFIDSLMESCEPNPFIAILFPFFAKVSAIDKPIPYFIIKSREFIYLFKSIY